MQTVSVLGCGWLGLPVAALLSGLGFDVKGSTTSPDKADELRAAGARPYVFRLDPTAPPDAFGDFFEADVLFLNVPPGLRRGGPDAPAHYKTLVEFATRQAKAAGVARLVFASSTGVYPDTNGPVTEDDARPADDAGSVLLGAEAAALAAGFPVTTVLRYGGLVGYDRRLVRYAAGRVLPNPDGFLNLIHRDDAAGLAVRALTGPPCPGLFNAVADVRPRRRDYYAAEAAALGLPTPTWQDDDPPRYKLAQNDRLKAALAYRFRYPDPAAGP